jgi:chromosome segregation ATPase
MTIDERLERLTERHEALTMTVEDLTRNVDKLEHAVETLADSQRRAEKRFNRFEAIVLRLGADFAERLRKLEEDGDQEKGGPETRQ